MGNPKYGGCLCKVIQLVNVSPRFRTQAANYKACAFHHYPLQPHNFNSEVTTYLATVTLISRIFSLYFSGVNCSHALTYIISTSIYIPYENRYTVLAWASLVSMSSKALTESRSICPGLQVWNLYHQQLLSNRVVYFFFFWVVWGYSILGKPGYDFPLLFLDQLKDNLSQFLLIFPHEDKMKWHMWFGWNLRDTQVSFSY